MMGWQIFRFMSARALRFFALILAGVAALICMIDSVELLRLGYSNILGSGTAVLWLAMRRTLVILQTILPFIMLLAAIFTLISLNRSRELVILRAAGLSVWNFMLPLACVAILCGLFAAFAVNPLAAKANITAEEDFALASADSGSKAADRQSSWLRQKSGEKTLLIGFAGSASQMQFLSGVTLFVLDADGGIESRVVASSARLDNGNWYLPKARIAGAEDALTSVGNFSIATDVNQLQLQTQFAKPDLMSVFDLRSAAEQALATGLSSAPFQQAFHANLAKPLFFLAMVIIALTICLRFGRFGRYDGMVLGGMLGGFLLYIFVEIFDGLGASGSLPPTAAIWVPLVVVILAAATLLLHQEDG